MNSREQQLAIERACAQLRFFKPTEDDVPQLQYVKGHSGPGWYIWDSEYPEEGSGFLGNNREIVTIAECIVRHELENGEAGEK